MHYKHTPAHADIHKERAEIAKSLAACNYTPLLTLIYVNQSWQMRLQTLSFSAWTDI
jgi:hypothetical protein